MLIIVFRKLPQKHGLRVNEEIRAKEIRVIDNENKQIGIMSPAEALKLAYEKELDLVEVVPTSSPPVCKILDFGKFLYEKQKKEKIAKKKQKQVQIKELKLRPLTESHDIEFKLKHARQFLEEGDKVKFSVKFKGRELAHQNLATDKLLAIAERLSDIAVIESKPTVQAKIMSMMLVRK